MTPPSSGSSILPDLLVRCSRHDANAFAQYYRRTSPFLNAVVGRQLGLTREVEAVLVETYVHVWREASSYVRTGTSSAWAWTLAIVGQAVSERSADLGPRSRVPRG